MRSLAALACLLLAPPAAGRCFDFTRKVTAPRRAPPPLAQGGELGDSGTTASGLTWATVRTQVPRSLRRVYELLLDHDVTRGEADEAVATLQKNEHYLALQHVRFSTSPLPLLTLRWTEVWAFALTRGTEVEPEEIVVSYEKTEGTSFIEHLCGSIVVRRVSADVTDLFWFEEAKVSRRSAEDTRNAIADIVKLLRER